MGDKSLSLSGPSIVYLVIVSVISVLYVTFNGSLAYEISEVTNNSRYYLRMTGRAGMVLLLLSFCASPLHKLFKSSWTQYLLRNRRYIGISTVIVLWSHFLVILSLHLTDAAWFEENVPLFILIPGAVTFICVGIMGLTSNDYSQKKLGRTTWKKIHLVGGYLAAVSFVSEYVLVIWLQPFLLPNYHFESADSPLLQYFLLSVALLIVYLRLDIGRKKILMHKS